MQKTMKIICIVLNIVAWLLFVLSLVRMLVAWNTLPDQIGIHFNADGNFDAKRNKILGFYPYLISFLTLVFFGVCGFLSDKVKLGLKINKMGDMIIRSQLKLMIFITELSVVFFFSGEWADAVIRQRPLNIDIPVLILFIFMFLLLLMVISIVIVRLVCRGNDK